MKKNYFALLAIIFCVVSASAAAKVVYLKPNSNWEIDGARFAVYYWNNSGGNGWISMTKVDGEEDAIYEAEIPEGNTGIIFCRMDPNNKTNGWGSEKWNQTGDLTVPTDDKVLFTIPDGAWDGSTGNWSTYTPPVVEVEAPKFDIPEGEFDETFYLTITAGEGATIYYTLDGNDPTTSSNVYSTPIEISETTTVKAIAVVNGKESSIKTATYTYFKLETANVVVFVNNKPNWENVYLYGWSNHMSPSFTKTWPGTEMEKIEADNTDFPIFAKEGTWYQLTNLTVPANETFQVIVNNGKNGDDGKQTANSEPISVENLDKDETTGTYYMYIHVPEDGSVTGVESVDVDENAPVEYYNFQGVRVANPENGMYIRVQGGKATKVIVR